MAENVLIAPEPTEQPEKKIGEMTLKIRNDGLARVGVPADFEIDIQQVKQIVDGLFECGKGKKYPLLIVVGAYTLPTPEARTYIATPESDPYASAEAYVINSFTQKLVGNVYLSFNKPARPTRLFNTEDKAIEWLRGFL